MRKSFRSLFASIFLLTLFFFCPARPAAAYSVLTHQAVIDVVWKPTFVPLLKQRFPGATPEELQKAHAYAYGGAIIQDLGYFPFGSKFFTDLAHYVRTGDFLVNMIEEAQTLPEYAFALGALSHYYCDNYGHAMATNKAVPLVYPELRARFGEEVTYEEDPLSHVKMEFSFDVLQVARGNYAPQSYQDFIGFEVSREVLERAFAKTYGLELKEQFGSLELAIGTYRRTVSVLIPDLTRAAWRMKKGDILQAQPGITRRQFQYRIRRADYHRTWGDTYQKPSLWHNFLSWVLRAAPKLGPNRRLAFKPPTPEAEKLFMQSFNTIVDEYSAGLKAIGKKTLELPNTDFDTGRRSQPGDYKKADEAYVELLQRLAQAKFRHVSPALKQHIIHYFQRSKAPIVSKEDAEKWEALKQALKQLQATEI